MTRKFLIITTVQGSIEAFLIPHIKLLEDMGYEVWIACNINKEILKELKENTWININFSRNPFSKNSLIALKQLKKLLKENNFEGIHCHTPVAALLSRFAAKLVGQKNVIYTAHGFHFFKGAPIVNWLIYYPMEYIAARWTDKIITINEEDYKRARSFCPSKTKVFKVEGVGLDLTKYSLGYGEKIRAEFKLKKEDFVISIIGELNQNKNQIQIIKAVELLKKENIETKLLIVGIGPKEKELKEYVYKNRLQNNIFFLGFRKDINNIVAASDILTSMSYREGLPRNIMEGMAQGKPFIVTNIRGNRDIIEDKKNGFKVEIGNHIQVVFKIKELLFNKELKDKIREKNYEDVRKYSLEKILNKIKQIIKIGE